ncbi:MAG: NAD(P)H-dependent oxidoreductase [Chloroflexi bacterium]|nr:NAD(P)H-dependent oxidoreductase [Chloroflexota bacterium]
MSEPVNVLALVGSLRRGSYNRALLNAALELAPDHMTIVTGMIADLPHYNADLDTDDKPEPVERLRAHMAQADALLIASPEYNHGIPGVLKNAIDWLSRPAGRSPMTGKTAAIMGAATGMWGTIRMQSHLRRVLESTGMMVVNKPRVLVNKARTRFDESGTLTDEDTRQFVQLLLENLADLTIRLRR